MKKYIVLLLGVLAVCMLFMRQDAPATTQLITTIYRYTGVSTDTKPSSGIPAGSTFYETDTGVTYIWNLSAWSVYYDQTPELSLAFPRQMINLPGLSWPDTVSVPSDSASVKAISDSSLYSEYTTYLNIYGNGTDNQDRALFSLPVVPNRTDFDTLFVWLKSNQTSTDSTKQHIALYLKDASGVTSVVDTTVTLASADTWERFAFSVSGLTISAHTLISETFVGRSHWIDVSPFYLK